LKQSNKNINPGHLCVLANQLSNMAIQHVLSKRNKHVSSSLKDISDIEPVHGPAFSEEEEII
jgi:hypothetical protein